MSDPTKRPAPNSPASPDAKRSRTSSSPVPLGIEESSPASSTPAAPLLDRLQKYTPSNTSWDGDWSIGSIIAMLGSPPTSFTAVDILSEVAKTGSNFFRTRSRADLQYILDKDEALAGALSRLADHQPFSVIVDTLGSLFNYVSSTDPVEPGNTKPTAIRAAWTIPIRNGMETTLLNSIRKAYLTFIKSERSVHYSNTATILQSSGTGKSRMVHEMRRLIFSLPFNIRDENEQSEWPPADHSIRKYMVAKAPSDELSIKKRYSFFFRVVFYCVRRWFQAQTPCFATYGEAVQAWNIFLDSKRDDVCKAIAALLNATVPEIDEESQKAKEQLKHVLDALACKGPLPVVPSDNAIIDSPLARVFDAPLDDLSRDKAKANAAEVPKLTRSNFQSVLIVVSFDDAQVLTRMELETPSSVASASTVLLGSAALPRTRHSVLLSVLNDLRENQIFALFPATSSHMGQFAPPRDLPSGARQSHSERLEAPITELPFDCGPLLPVQVGSLYLKDVSSVYFMAQFGRPLFWAMMEQTHGRDAPVTDHHDKASMERRIMTLACTKLAGTDDVPGTKTDESTTRLAALDVRLCFDYETRKAISTNYEATLIANHMRLAYSAPTERQFIRSGYSSEPILAEAAARLMRELMEPVEGDVFEEQWNLLTTLQKFLRNGLIRGGDRGELVARYIIMKAYDTAMARLNEDNMHDWWSFSDGCGVVEFIQALFPSSIADAVLNSRPDNILEGEGGTSRDAFSKSSVRFTHYVKLGDSTGLTSTALCAAFIRGMAFIAHPSQEYIDLLVPILCDRDGPVAPHNITALVVQINCRARPGAAGVYDYSAEELGMFQDSDPASSSRPLRPYCTLLMELGVYATMRQTEEASNPSQLPVPPAPVRRLHRSTSASSRHVHPRYNIRAYGCSSGVYGVISDAENAMYHAVLLLDRDVTSDHPRPQNLQHVWNMKPLWVHSNRDGVEVDSYNWLEGAGVNEAVTDFIQEESVYVCS